MLLIITALYLQILDSASENKAVIKTHKKHFFVIICFAKN